MKKIASTVVAVLVASLALAAGALVFTEFQWFASLGHANVLLISYGARIIAIAAFTIPSAALFVYTGISTCKKLDIKVGKLLRTVLVVLAFVLATISSIYISSQWMTLRLAVSGATFSMVDPFTGLDASFFVFILPALELIGSWLAGVVIITAIWIAGISFLVPQQMSKTDTPDLATILTPVIYNLISVLCVIAGYNIAVGTLTQVYSQTAPLPGVSEIDAMILFPGGMILAAIGLLTAVVVFLSKKNHTWKRAAASFGVWAAAGIVITMVLPPVINTLVINPNELAREESYITRSIEMTRKAYDLDRVVTDQFAATPTVDAKRTDDAIAELKQARIWTPSAVSQAFKQLETIRPYYKLSKVQQDRYEVNGESHEVLIAAREINTKGLPSAAENWINEKLVYTHGYGVTVASATLVSPDGFPQFLVGDVPPTRSIEASTSASLEVTEPRIYFGDNTSAYAIVNTTIDEFDHTEGAENTTTRYDGGGGIALDGMATKAAWALKLRSLNVLLSGYLNADSQVLMTRSINDRAAKIAPWLELDDTPYPAIVEGKIVWILDGFTSSTRFPYAKTLKGSKVNYLRNSVKVVMDAYTGETTFYAFGDDPIRDAWDGIYPGVITPITDAPVELAAHFRYPDRLFNAQVEIYRTYHMSDAKTFYNKEDVYGTFKNADDSKFPATYTIVNVAGKGREFSLMQPLSIADKDNMVSMVVASCDASDYGQLTNYALPRDRVILGPAQITARIQQDPEISPQLALWSQNDNTIVYGNMLILPVQDSIAYVQPIFLKAANAAITELVGVVVVSDNHVRMGSTIDEALAATFSAVE